MTAYYNEIDENAAAWLRETGVAVDDIAARFGRSRRAVTNKLKLLRSAK